MTELFNQLLEKAKTDKRTLLAFKNAAVRSKQFELAANLRELETTLFPESEEAKKAKAEAKKINLLFRMVGVDAPEHIGWLIAQALRLHSKKKGKFSVDDAERLKHQCKELFEID
jgi:hypothetical protein